LHVGDMGLKYYFRPKSRIVCWRFVGSVRAVRSCRVKRVKIMMLCLFRMLKV
jgi:hypothetical protein